MAPSERIYAQAIPHARCRNAAWMEAQAKAFRHAIEEIIREGIVAGEIAGSPWIGYGHAKKGLSRLCGWDAGANHDQRKYDMAFPYVVDRLGV